MKKSPVQLYHVPKDRDISLGNSQALFNYLNIMSKLIERLCTGKVQAFTS